LKSKESLEKIIDDLMSVIKADENLKLKEYTVGIEEDPKHDSHLLRVEVQTALRQRNLRFHQTLLIRQNIKIL
jgi:hypothetical protein